MKLGLVLPARVRNPSREMGRYWVPIMDALEGAGVHVRLTQPHVSIVQLPGAAQPIATVTGPLFLRELLRERPDAVLTSEFGTHSLWTAVAGRLLRTPVLVFHEHAERSDARPGALRLAYRKVLLRLAHGAVANTPAARGDLEDALGVSPARIADVALLVPPERDALCRVQPDLPDAAERPVFLFAGRLVRQKNVGALLAAAETLWREGLGFTLWIAGEGEERATLQTKVARSGLDRHVLFLGQVDYPSIGFLLGACDVFVMPSLRDYRSVAVLEAMRFGKPVIDSAGDGNAGDPVRDGVNGLVVDPGNVESIARAMRVFIANPGQIRSMGRAAAAAVEELTPSRAATALRGLLEQLLSEQRRQQLKGGPVEAV
jgi:glycosyltransferase involved in cell wall biosynthesis